MNKIKNVLISEKLREVISEFKNKSLVASLLLEEFIFEDQLVPNHVNYLSTSNSDKTKISYLTPERISKIDPSDIWSTSKRYHSKPGSIISKIYKNIPPREIENFSNLFRAFADEKEFEFQIVKGSDIIKYYHQDSYVTHSGSLGNSCMKYDRCSKFLEMYNDNDMISMLVMKNNEGGLIGRALLWEFNDSEFTFKVKIMDRIYTISDEDYQYYFMKWADDNGFIYKKRQNWGSTIQYVNKGKDIESRFEIQLKEWDYSYFPYLDTFKWLDRNTGKLYNYRPEHFTNRTNDYCILMSPEGSYSNADCLEFDSITKDWHHQGNLQYVEYCDLLTQRDNLHYSETIDGWILKDDCYYDEDLRDYLFKDLSKIDSELISKRRSYIDKLIEREKLEAARIAEKISELKLDESFISNHLRIDDYIMRHIQGMNIEGYRVTHEQEQ
jgi:hypothetical protein